MIGLDIDVTFEPDGETGDLWGRHSFISRTAIVQTKLLRRFGRRELCLKVFTKSAGMAPDTFRWGSRNFMPTLDETTRAQNLLALHGLAPRVYGVVRLSGGELAQVTDFVASKSTKRRKGVEAATGQYGIVCDRRPKLGHQPDDWRGGLLVDCCGLRFRDADAYLTGLRERASATPWGREGTKGYQAVPEIGLDGRRDFRRRVEWMRLDEAEFASKTVLDIGCNLGSFCRYAARRGAVRVVGVDVDAAASAAFEIANWLELWNVDYLALDLPDQASQIAALSGIERFDVVFLLASVRHVGGWAGWIDDLCADVLYLEGHSVDKRETYENGLRAAFGTVEYLGKTKDHFPRPLFRCRR